MAQKPDRCECPPRAPYRARGGRRTTRQRAIMSCRPCLRRVKATAMQAANAISPARLLKLSHALPSSTSKWAGTLSGPCSQIGQQRMLAVSSETRSPARPCDLKPQHALAESRLGLPTLQQGRVGPDRDAMDDPAVRAQRIGHDLQPGAVCPGGLRPGLDHEIGPQEDPDEVGGHGNEENVDDPRCHAPPESRGDGACRHSSLRHLFSHGPITLEGPPGWGGPSPSIRDPQIASSPSAESPIAGGDPGRE